MDRDYLENRIVKILISRVEEPSSLEKEVQALWESLLWIVFPSMGGWMNYTKYKLDDTEPDNRTTTFTFPNDRQVDVLHMELKREREDKRPPVFNQVAFGQLNRHMQQSANEVDTILFGGVGIGAYVLFYQKTLPNGNVIQLHDAPFHLIDDAALVQQYFEYFKANIPGVARPASSGPLPAVFDAPQMMTSDAPLAAIPNFSQAESSSYAVENTTTYAPVYYGEATNENEDGTQAAGEGEPETGPAESRYHFVDVTRVRYLTKGDVFKFTDKRGETRSTAQAQWRKGKYEGRTGWKFHDYVTRDRVFD